MNACELVEKPAASRECGAELVRVFDEGGGVTVKLTTKLFNPNVVSVRVLFMNVTVSLPAAGRVLQCSSFDADVKAKEFFRLTVTCSVYPSNAVGTAIGLYLAGALVAGRTVQVLIAGFSGR